MNDTAGALAAGLVLGVVFYGGLWWTVRHLVAMRSPPLVLAGSALLRTGVVIGGICWVADGQWSRIAMCLAGFVIARLGVTWATRRQSASVTSAATEIGHAP